MIYYRIAMQVNHPSRWQWRSTVLSSLGAVLGFLRIYGCIPKDSIRVFFASSPGYMDELLVRENQGLTSNSLTAEQFLSGRRMNILEMTHLEAELSPQGNKKVVPATIVAEQSANEGSSRIVDQSSNEGSRSWEEKLLNERGMNSLDMRRLELELSSIGDHDVPYQFYLPIFMPQVLAWTSLLAKVQNGELEL